MSKSLNNLYTLADLAERGYDPIVYRMFNFTSHYRNKINFTWEALDSAKVALNRLKDAYQKHLNGTENVEDSVIADYKNRFLEAINDDLNMPLAMSVVWDVAKNNVKSKKFADLLLDFDQVLGLKLDEVSKVELPDEIMSIINDRKIARENKNWAESDRLRDLLNEKGYNVKDTKDGMEVTEK